MDPYTVRLSEYEVISIEALPGVNGYYLVKFSTYSSLNETIIDYLSKWSLYIISLWDSCKVGVEGNNG